ncbi:MAG: NUDIX hydrolase [Planctomycetes bacterium]|nr:NUDIX hydrolase [Planctomycetota bacterium]
MSQWIRTASAPLGDFRVFTLREDILRSPRTGTEHSYYVIEAPDWVNVIAVTTDEQIVLIRQHRAGTGHATLEIPGGMVDPGETPLEAARRELSEETGFVSDDWTELGRVSPNPAIQSNSCFTFLARDARRAGPQQLDGTEDIAVELHHREALHERITSGEIDHALVVAAAYWWKVS